MRQKIKFTIFLTVLIFAGCSTPYYPYFGLVRLDGFREASTMNPKDNSVSKPNNQYLRVAGDNRLAINWYKENEWQYNREGSKSPPVIGLAMSGGGIRSASYNIGVMKGLSEIGVLDKVDLMSSVSGGSYAMSWYFLQQFYSGHKIEDNKLFDPDGDFQKYLEEHGELIGSTNNTINRRIEYVVMGAIPTFISTPINLVTNGLFGWHMNISPLRRFYQMGIERTYHTISQEPKYPNQDNSKFIPSKTRLNVLNEAGFCELGKFALEKHLPYFIINTTAKLEDSTFQSSNSLAAKVFEFAPLRYGSDYFGYQYKSPDISVTKAVSISGAAFDSNELIRNKAGQTFASAFNADLGYYIDNYRVSTTTKVTSYPLPFPFYLIRGRYQKDIEGTDIYLMDGGFSDNLGAYSLVKRLPQNIIIVDAEFDPTFRFEAYFKLKSLLKSEMNVDLVVKEIEKTQSVKVDRFNPILPVMFGSIDYFPYLNDKKIIEARTIQVIYIKLYINPNHSEDHEYYTQNVVNAYLTYRNEKNDPDSPSNSGGQFPYQGTGDLSYTTEQFLGYRDLGYKNITNCGNKIVEFLNQQNIRVKHKTNKQSDKRADHFCA